MAGAPIRSAPRETWRSRAHVARMGAAALALVTACSLEEGGGLSREGSASTIGDGSETPATTADAALDAGDALDAAALDAPPAAPCAVPPQGLSAWVRARAAYDGAWAPLSVTTRGAPKVVSLADGTPAFQLAGGADAIVCGAGDLVLEAPLALTVEGWVTTSDTSANARLADRTVPNRPDTGWGFDVLSGGVLRLFYGALDAQFHVVHSPAGAIAANTWQHVAGTVLGSSSGPGGTVDLRVYVDGVEVGAATFPDQRRIPQSTLPLTLGNSAVADATPPLGLVGGMRELAVWRRALTAREIAAVSARGAEARCGL